MTAFKMNGEQFTPKGNFFKRQIAIFPSVVIHTNLRKRQSSSFTEIMKNAFLMSACTAHRYSPNRIKRSSKLGRSDGPGSMTSFSKKSPFCNADALKTTRNFVVDAASRTTAWCTCVVSRTFGFLLLFNCVKLLIIFHEHVLVRFQVVLLH